MTDDIPENTPENTPENMPAGMPDATAAAAIEASILALTMARGQSASICPSEVARALSPKHWRPLMGPVRQAALRLQAADRIDILRKGKPVPADAVRGVIRLRSRPSAA